MLFSPIKKINKFLGKGMSNIYLKVAIERKSKKVYKVMFFDT